MTMLKPAVSPQQVPADLWTFARPKESAEADQELRGAIFNLIAPAGDWKEPIDAWVPAPWLYHAQRAAVWFCGCELQVVDRNCGKLRVQGDGYYLTIGA